MMLQEHQIVPYNTSTLPVESGPWLVLAPHADDESFGMGGALAKAADAGVETHLCILTDGALGGSELDLVHLRQREAREAAKVLGIDSVLFYHQSDRHLNSHPVLLQRLVDHIRVLKPAALFFPGVYELHPDHRACAQLAWHLLQRLGHDAPLGVSYEISTQSPANCLVDISQHMTRKQQAMNVYQSQLEQNNYMDVVLALNKLRTYTLGSEVAWAEAFYCYGNDELAEGLAPWATAQVAAMLAESK